ncbi:hypothetical protein PQR66_23860 [Paraburkholderia agricolaris]|uniref:Rhamnosyltransferase n=1 Tax=Paraburkholderia agricolaris TaxID=2152888 RepID=A0ABW8ZV80_9BURK
MTTELHSTEKPVFIDVIIPTLGVRESIFDVISTLERLATSRASVKIRVFTSFNPKNGVRTVYLKDAYDRVPNFSVQEIGPASYEPTSEHHVLWCLKWHREHCADADSVVWILTDNDPIIESGFDAVVGFLRSHTPDLFFVNFMWGDVQGELLPSPAFRVNQLIWHGDASYFFRSQGFEHATSGLGCFFVRGSFLTDEVIAMYERTLARSVVCAHAWWMMEAGMSSKEFYLVGTPVLLNKINPHNFDDSWVWVEAAEREGVQAKFSWTIGYLRHLDYYVQKGKMTWQEIRTSMLSEPQRGILLFLDDVLRQMFVQAKLALRRPGQRFDAPEIDLIKRVWGNVYPLRMPMINFLCDVLDRRNENQIVRLRSYKFAIRFRAIEEEQGIFFPLFRNAMYGYYYLEHNSGFVALLDKGHVYKAYRDLDPVDISPYILYAPTEDAIIEKIKEARQHARPDALLHNFDYWTVLLRPALNPVAAFPHLQLRILSQKEAVIRMVKRLVFPISFVRRNINRVLSIFR